MLKIRLLPILWAMFNGMVGPSSMSGPIEMRCDESSESQLERRDATDAANAIGGYARNISQIVEQKHFKLFGASTSSFMICIIIQPKNFAVPHAFAWYAITPSMPRRHSSIFRCTSAGAGDTPSGIFVY
ncbi:unnamed protein product [Trichogramma brassicae]|uniref:Secreted protein n=1 Tax=Trichogramma brassicae TaxID=86971 RepID=A0A6H5HSQ1_9HYME|nr:unnamed protein product [Trichogramma brassicae]